MKLDARHNTGWQYKKHEGPLSAGRRAARGPFGSPPCTFTDVISASGGRWPLAVSHSIVIVSAISSEALIAGSLKWHTQTRMSSDTCERAHIWLKYMSRQTNLVVRSHSMSQLSSSVNSKTLTDLNPSEHMAETHTHTPTTLLSDLQPYSVTAEHQCKHHGETDFQHFLLNWYHWFFSHFASKINLF